MCGCPAVSWQSHVSSLWRRSCSGAVASLSITRSEKDLLVYIEKHKKRVEAHGRHLYSVVSKLVLAGEQRRLASGATALTHRYRRLNSPVWHWLPPPPGWPGLALTAPSHQPPFSAPPRSLSSTFCGSPSSDV